jgi:hypothetical protein
MDNAALTQFFMWCTIINGAILIVWSAISVLAPDLIYRMQSTWFPMPRETFTVVVYALTGVLKIFFLVFSAVPYVALLLV